MPLRLPFSRRQDAPGTSASESAPTQTQSKDIWEDATSGENAPKENGHLSVADSATDLSGRPFSSKSSSSINIIKAAKKEEPNTYQLCVVSGGVYLPPSPPAEKRTFWHRSRSSNTARRDEPSIEEPFTISRESFDSYRRSFDISARSPVRELTSPRRSLDVRRSPNIPTPPRTARTSEEVDSLREEFEDVDLNDENQPPKRKGLLSKVLGGASHRDGNGPPRKLAHLTIHESELERMDKVKKDTSTSVAAGH